MRLQRCLSLLFVLLIQWACHSGEAQQSGNQSVTPASKPATTVSRFLSVQLKLPEKPYSQSLQRQRFAQQVISRIKALPDVESVAAGSAPPDSYETRGTQTESLVNKSGLYSYKAVTPEYFDVLKLNLVKGRLFEERDRSLDVRLMIISESVARELFEDRGLDSIGQRIALYEGSKKGPWFEVVGVVSDAQNETGKARKDNYGLYYHDPTTNCALTECIYIIVRIKTQSETVTEKLKDEIMAVDKEVTISDVKSLEYK
jgi:hypothetical protein